MSEKTINQFSSDTYFKLFSLFESYDRQLVRVLKSMLDFEPSRILDLACGVGLSTNALQANFTNARIAGVDIDSELIEYAQKRTTCSNVEFECSEISEMLTEIPDNSIDMVFVKSAYHYFERQIPISHFKRVLTRNGVVALAERTSRSAKTYPLPDIASAYWTDIFSQPRPDRRFDAAVSSEMELTVSCYGESVALPSDIYLEAVKKDQLVGIWMLNPDIVDEWINDQIAKEIIDFKVFEEFWLYLYRNETEYKDPTQLHKKNLTANGRE